MGWQTTWKKERMGVPVLTQWRDCGAFPKEEKDGVPGKLCKFGLWNLRKALRCWKVNFQPDDLVLIWVAGRVVTRLVGGCHSKTWVSNGVSCHSQNRWEGLVSPQLEWKVWLVCCCPSSRRLGILYLPGREHIQMKFNNPSPSASHLWPSLARDSNLLLSVLVLVPYPCWIYMYTRVRTPPWALNLCSVAPMHIHLCILPCQTSTSTHANDYNKYFLKINAFDHRMFC